MTFLSPAYLYGLFGLLLPIAIHIWSKKEGRLIRVGSTQFFPEAESKQSSSLHLNEVWLLILRLLLITTLVLILAEPMMSSIEADKDKFVLLTPGIKENQQIKTIRDSLTKDGYKLKWLSDGFPDYDEAVKLRDTTYYWQLLSELQALESNNIVVICDLKLRDLLGKRPELPFNPAVIFVESDSTKAFLAEAHRVNSNSFKITKGVATPQSITFSEQLVGVDQVSIQENKLRVSNLSERVTIDHDTVSFRFKIDEKYHHEVFFIKAAIRSIKTYTKWALIITEDYDADWLIWLSDDAVAHDSANNLLTIRLNETQEIINYNVNNETYELTKRLTEDVVIEEKLAIKLLKLLRENHFEQSLKIANRYDIRKVDEKQMAAKSTRTNTEKIIRQAASPYLWWLLLTLLIGERVLSFVRKQ